MPHQRLRLVSFLLVSSVAHALGLSMWNDEHVVVDERALGEPLVTVIVTKGTLPVETERNGAISRKMLNRRGPAETVQSPAEAQRDIAAPASESVDKKQRTDAHNALLGAIRTRLSQHLDYPPLARHRGWQGEVLLGFAIAVDGHVSDVRVARSSGYDILDKSALESLRKVGRLTAEELHLAAPIPDLRLPVIYRLTEN